MRISYRWLKEFIDTYMSANELAYKITMAGLEVDSVNKIETYDSVVGEIKKIDKKGSLYLTSVDTGGKLVNVATSDTSIDIGDKFPVAESGNRIADGISVEKRKFGDFVSEGIMLSAAEIGLEDTSSGLFKLDKDFKNGTKLSDLDEFDDYLIEIELTPNRADALSIIGIARDIRALTKLNIKYPEMNFSVISKNINNYISVNVENFEGAPRYTLLMADVKVDESPFFIRSRLIKSGIRPINNIVDITNYVLMALGQPMHAFDFNRLNGDISVRNAKRKEKILALDGREYELNDNILVIADAKSPIAIAGVMGGEDSGVVDSTKTIALESAYFNPVGVRLAARKLKLHTESSHRFERGVDPNLCLTASSYALCLLENYAQAKIYSGYIDKKNSDFKARSFVCSFSGINSLIGSDFEQKDIKKTLEYLEFKPKVVSIDKFKVTVPTYRFDIECEADIAEEVARCVGYDKVPSTLPVVQASFKQSKPVDYIKHSLTKALADTGFMEVVNYSFIDSGKLRLFNDKENEFVYLKNPLIEGQDVMRTTLSCGLLDSLKFNMNKNAKSAALFEMGRVFFKDNDYSKEFDHLGVLMWGEASFNWFEKDRTYDFYDIKMVPEIIEHTFNIEFGYKKSNKAFLHAGRSAELFIGKDDVGFIGELHPDLYEKYDMKFDKKTRILLCEINLDIAASNLETTRMYEKLPKLPTVARDLAIVVDKNIPADDVKKVIESFDDVYEVALFDIYDKLRDKNKKSLAFRIVLKNDRKTFTDSEIEDATNSIFNALKVQFDANLRGGEYDI